MYFSTRCTLLVRFLQHSLALAPQQYTLLCSRLAQHHDVGAKIPLEGEHFRHRDTGLPQRQHFGLQPGSTRAGTVTQAEPFPQNAPFHKTPYERTTISKPRAGSTNRVAWPTRTKVETSMSPPAPSFACAVASGVARTPLLLPRLFVVRRDVSTQLTRVSSASSSTAVCRDINKNPPHKSESSFTGQVVQPASGPVHRLKHLP